MPSLIPPKLRRLLSLSPLLLAVSTASAQTALDYFNGGAQSYISNNIPNALSVVEKGLKTYPDDEKLKKLEQLLKQQQQQQQQQNQQQQQQNQQSQNQQQQSQQQKQDQQKSQDQQKQGEQKQQDEQKKDQDQQKQEQGKPEDQDKDKDGKKEAQAAAMTPEEAKQLLNNQKNSEQYLALKPKDKSEQLRKLLPDW